MRQLGVFIAMVLTFSYVTALQAQDITNRVGVGYRYGFYNADDDDFKTNANSHNLNLTYGLTENVALEWEGGYYRLKSKAGTKLGVYSAHVNLQLRKGIGKFVPYVSGGVGAQRYSYSELGTGDRKDKVYSYSWRSGAGTEYFLTKNWALNAEAVYIYGNTGGSATLDVYGWQYGGGVKYYF